MSVEQLYRGPHHLWQQEVYVFRRELREALGEAAIDLDEFPDPDPSADDPARLSSTEPERRIKLRLMAGWSIDFLWVSERRWRMFLKRLEERS